MTDEIDTKNMAGESVIKVNSASGICIQLFAIENAPRYSPNVPQNPIIAKATKATLKIRSAPLLSPNS